MGVHQMHGHTHYGKVRSVYFFYGHHANPILRAIRTSFIVRLIGVHIEFNFLASKFLESHFGVIVKAIYLFVSSRQTAVITVWV
jgi:hypothetical protein